jgi:uncharacterized protein YndB with AHSA1/START domain
MLAGGRTFTVRFHHPVGRVFDYLSDPRLRPEWQLSLRRVEPLNDVETGVGARWRDVTVVGLGPVLEVVTHEPGREWAEQGSWRGVAADLSLTFTSCGEDTDVGVRFRLSGSGLYRLPAAATTLLTAPALRSDLARADRMLGRRG